ncbi:MAG: hypothetical protein AABX47_00190 [Nanoarchaeota archaeon]
MAEESAKPFYTPLAECGAANHQEAQASATPQQTTVASAPAAGPVKAAQTPHFSPEVSGNPIVSQFTTRYHSAIANAKSGKDSDARADYSEMLKLYNALVALPDMHDMNKDIAHFCLQDVYDSIAKNSDPNVSRLSFGALIGITMLLIVIGGIIATNPSIVGLVTGLVVKTPAGPQWIGGEQAVVITGPTTIHMGSLFATGDRAGLTFLATSSSTLDAIVSDDFVTLVPKYGATGTTRIYLVAARSDNPKAMTRAPVDVTVAKIT